MLTNKAVFGDCLPYLQSLPDKSVDMFITSPPYAEKRKNVYDSIPVDKYVEWFLPIAREVHRCLKPTGSFHLNIKAHSHKGERSLYVMELVIALKRQVGFYYVDEFAWVKNAFPGLLAGRFKNGWEPVHHFTVAPPTEIKFNPLACGTPVKPETYARARRKQVGNTSNGSNMSALKGHNLLNLTLARPSNVVVANNVTNQFTDRKKHPAVFPKKLVEFFVLSFTDPGDWIVDPFSGSGTTGEVCLEHGRSCLMIDNKHEFYEMSCKAIGQVPMTHPAIMF